MRSPPVGIPSPSMNWNNIDSVRYFIVNEGKRYTIHTYTQIQVEKHMKSTRKHTPYPYTHTYTQHTQRERERESVSHDTDTDHTHMCTRACHASVTHTTHNTYTYTCVRSKKKETDFQETTVSCIIIYIPRIMSANLNGAMWNDISDDDIYKY